MTYLKQPSLCALILALIFSLNLQAQETETGLPGDNLSLEAVLDLFKKSESMEDFEKQLNTEDNYINNLDLNEDGEIDYIRVEDHVEKDAHAIVLQVAISEDESQDVAVIEIEKDGAESAILQIIGDEAVYGENIIVEPFEEEKANKSGKGGPNFDGETVRLVVNVWFWPSVRFIYSPRYVVWTSPWRWRVYPRWWRPWTPRPWSWYAPRHAHYRTSFRVVSVHRVTAAHRVYTPRRRTSKVVVNRTTVVKRNNGKVVAGKKSTSTKVVKGKNGAVAGKKSTTTTGVAKTKNGKVAAGKTTTTKTGVKGANGAKAGKKTTTKTGVAKGKNGKVVAGKKTTTTKAAQGRNGKAAGTKRTTTTKVGKGKNGAKAGQRTTTVKKRRKG